MFGAISLPTDIVATHKKIKNGDLMFVIYNMNEVSLIFLFLKMLEIRIILRTNWKKGYFI